ncbi:fimbrial protein [Stenotrophomonas rhizophila]|uniref:fimbrial protein n=1 Tax=Stenotrophomonas rhizophila TaxID=216778 RepID=UPI00224AD095|nr:fimbrial protein [Stenotrophomonas rhizophila]MCX2919318.1 fimbrial protein [Stenotrophomonas rhizophila]
MNAVALRSATLLALIATTPTALADTATLTISGRVLPGTCTLNAPAIALDPVKADELTQGDNKLKTGSLDFSGCVGVNKATLSFAGTAADGDAERWKNTAAADAADGVSIALLQGATGTTYLKNGDTGIDVPVTGSTATFALRAGYYLPTVGAANAGAVQTEITVTADYE